MLMADVTLMAPAAMSAMYAFYIAVFVYKDLTLKQVGKVLLNSASPGQQ